MIFFPWQYHGYVSLPFNFRFHGDEVFNAHAEFLTSWPRFKTRPFRAFYKDATTEGTSISCRSLVRRLRDAFQTKVTVVDFTVTQKGLEEQLLGSVIQKEQKSLEEQLNNVLEEVCR